MATALFNRPLVSYSRVNFSLALHSIDWPNGGLRRTHSAGCVFHVRFVFVGRSYALSFAKTLQAHKSHPVTMLQARPHAIHFKRIWILARAPLAKADVNLTCVIQGLGEARCQLQGLFHVAIVSAFGRFGTFGHDSRHISSQYFRTI